MIVAESPELREREPELLPPATPRVSSTNPRAVGTFDQATWESPAFMRSNPNNFGGLLGSQFDPFAEDDGFVPGRGRKRPRYSFQRADWRLLDEPISPQDSEGNTSCEGESWEITAEDDQKDHIGRKPQPTTSTGSGIDGLLSDAPNVDQNFNIPDSLQEESDIFVKPSLELTGSMFGRRAPEPNNTTQHRTTITQDVLGTVSHLPTDTPQLRPIPSPGLPIPSPIVSGQSNSQGYFSEFHTVSQAQGPQPVSSELLPRGQVATFGFGSQGSLPHEQQAALEDAFNGAEMHPNEGTISNSSVFGDNHLPETLSLDTSFNVSRRPLGKPEDLQPPPLGGEHAFTEPAVQNVFEDQTQLDSADDDYNSIANEQDIEGRVGDDVDEGSDGQDGAQDENSNHDGESESELSGDDAIYGDLHREEHLLSALAEGAQAAIDVGTLVEEEEGHALEAASSRDDLSGKCPMYDNRGPRLPLQDSNDESDSIDEDAIDDVDDAASNYSSQYDYDDEGEGETQAEESSGDGSESAQRPPSQPSQPEIIVLDSDSEVELASDQHVSPRSVSQQNERDCGSFVMPESAEFEMEENGDDWSLSEPGTPTREAESSRQEDRVDDSDLEENDSSVDALASEHDFEQDLLPESPSEEENIEDEEAVSEDQDVNGHIASKTNPHLTIELDLDSDEARRDARASRHPDELVENRQEQDMPAIWRIGSAFDGASDQDQPQQLQDAKIEDQAEIEHENLDLDNGSVTEAQKNETGYQMAHGPSDIKTDVGLVRGIEPQLPTPDPTQVVVDDQPSGLPNPVFSVHPDSQTISLGPNISLDCSQDSPSDRTTLAPNDTVQEFASNHDVKSGEHDISTWPVTEAVAHEAASPRGTRGKASEATAVLISNPPAPNRQAHGLRSKYAYFAPLGTVIDHYNALVDTISIVNETSPISRAVSGSKDYYLTLQLSDPSMAGTLLQAQIFRRHKSALPSLSEGDAILLRDFKVRTYDHAMMLVSVDTSSWAVFDGSSHEAQVNGPPVEYGPEERAYASGLRRWYTEIGADTIADYQMQAVIEKDNMDRESSPGSVMGSDVGSMDSSLRGDVTPSARGSRKSRRRSHRRVTIHELRDGRRYTEVGSPSSKESIHELRDGTVYANL